MSEETNAWLCQWEGCATAAVKHVQYNIHPGGILASDARSDIIGIAITHADLCGPHLKEVKEQYGYVNEMSRWQCGDTCKTNNGRRVG
jgi:hypothetical protein